MHGLRSEADHLVPLRNGAPETGMPVEFVESHLLLFDRTPSQWEESKER